MVILYRKPVMTMKPVESYLRAVFNRFAVPAASLALFFSLSSQARAQSPAQKDAPVVESVVDTTHAAQMESLQKDFRRTSEGRKLLDMAAEFNVTIAFEDSLRVKQQVAGYYNSIANHIAIDPTLSPSHQLSCLAHELWHVRQMKIQNVPGFIKRDVTPQQYYAAYVYCEADAGAYAAWFMANRAHELKIPLEEVSEDLFTQETAKKLYAEMQTSDGLTSVEYLTEAVEPSFLDMDGYHYRGFKNLYSRYSYMLEALKITNEFPPEMAMSLLEKYRSLFDDRPSDREFEDFLRGFGGVTVEFNRQTALEDKNIPVSRLLDEYAYRTNDPFTKDTADDSTVRELVQLTTNIYNKFHDRVFNINQEPVSPVFKTPAFPMRTFHLKPLD